MCVHLAKCAHGFMCYICCTTTVDNHIYNYWNMHFSLTSYFIGCPVKQFIVLLYACLLRRHLELYFIGFHWLPTAYTKIFCCCCFWVAAAPRAGLGCCCCCCWTSPSALPWCFPRSQELVQQTCPAWACSHRSCCAWALHRPEAPARCVCMLALVDSSVHTGSIKVYTSVCTKMCWVCLMTEHISFHNHVFWSQHVYSPALNIIAWSTPASFSVVLVMLSFLRCKP